MIGDIILIEEIHKLKAKIILPHILSNYKNKMVISIGGISGCGKSEISLVLQKLLWENNIKSKIIHIDDYYYIDYHSRDEERKKTGIIGKEEINWKKLNEVIINFKENRRKLYVQRIHKYLDSIEYSISPGHKINVLLIDGLYSLFLKKNDFAIYLEGEIENTYDFRLRRGKENPNDEFRKKVLEKESKDIKNSKKFSDLIIPFYLKEDKKNKNEKKLLN